MPETPTQVNEPIERRRSGRSRAVRRLLPVAAPLLVGLLALGMWELIVWWRELPPYLLPGPVAISKAIIESRESLFAAWLVTFKTMSLALLAAVVGGVLLAVGFTVSRLAELTLFPYAIVLQVTPLVAIAPLLLIWIGTPWLVMLVAAWIVAFFPILSNTVVGLRSVDPGLDELFKLYGASRWQRLRLLLTPSALPYFLAGLRVAVNLALVGAVVAEFVTGAATDHPGLASLVFEAQYMTNGPKTFAALAMISLTGIAMYFAVHLLSQWLLRGWHPSAVSNTG